MNRYNRILGLALAVQLVLVVAVFWPRQDLGLTDARAPLLQLKGDNIHRVIISDDTESLLLSRGEAGWTMPGYHGLPADPARIASLLSDLPTLPRGWPVASSAEAAERFEVAANKFQREVEYFAGETSAGGIFIGTAPGFRRVHARVKGGDSIYSIEYNSFDLPAEPAQWLDKSLLRISNPTVIRGLDYQLLKEGDSWRGADAAEPVAQVLGDLLGGVTGLRVTGAADMATAGVLDSVAAPPTLVVSTANKEFQFRLYELEENYYIQRGDIPLYFELAAYDYDRLNDASAESLYPAPEQDSEASAEDTDNAGNTN